MEEETEELTESNMIAEGVVENGIVEFAMDETQHQNVTFTIVVTAMGGS